METSFRIKLSELDTDIIKIIKQLFKKDREITLTISSSTDFDLNKAESKQEYLSRLKKAIKNLDEGKGVAFTEEELNQFIVDKLKK
ncbi:MAG: hypothetical protein ABI855_05975 [Bacteroidota bacterium]